jgi:hypothetical protein
MAVLLAGFASDALVTPVLYRRFYGWGRSAAVPARAPDAAAHEESR